MNFGPFPLHKLYSAKGKNSGRKKEERLYILRMGLIIIFFFCHSFSSKHLSCLHERAMVHFLKISRCVFVVPCKAPLSYSRSTKQSLLLFINTKLLNNARLRAPVAHAECNCTITTTITGFTSCLQQWVCSHTVPIFK